MDQPTSPSNPSPDNQPDLRAHGKTRPPNRGNPAEPEASGKDADRLTVLAHELGNLLDGSLRSLSLAKRSMQNTNSPDGGNEGGGGKRLDIVQKSLMRMAEIVDAAMRQSGPRGSVLPLPATSIELGEAIFHAVDVLTPLAATHGISISTVVSNGLSGLPTGTLYSAIVNGLTNAVEAVVAAGGDGGRVEVSAAWTEHGKIRITIQDDGCGLPDVAQESLCRFGYSTKARGSGLGLSLTRTIVDELPGGELRLANRTDRGNTDRPGAVFEITYRPDARGNASDAAGAA